MSPLDESGYLVPINLNLNKPLNESGLNNDKKLVGNQLTRSFSTRSAYSSSNFYNPTSKNILNNRATICEQISTKSDSLTTDYCVKCNAKLNAAQNGSKSVSYYNV